MRPSPLVLLALAACGFALIAVPLARLTGAEGAWRGQEPTQAGMAEGEAGVGEVPAVVRVRFAHPPLKVMLTEGGRLVAKFEAPKDEAGGLLEQLVRLRVLAEDPMDVLVEATWPDGTPPTALGVELEPDGFETRRATVWAEGGTLVELLTFSWK